MSYKYVNLLGALLLAFCAVVSTPSSSQAVDIKKITLKNHSFERVKEGWIGRFDWCWNKSAATDGESIAYFSENEDVLIQYTDYTIEKDDIFVLAVDAGCYADQFHKKEELSQNPEPLESLLELEIFYGYFNVGANDIFMPTNTYWTKGDLSLSEFSVRFNANDKPDCIGEKLAIMILPHKLKGDSIYNNRMDLDNVRLWVWKKRSDNADVRANSAAIVINLNKGIANAVIADPLTTQVQVRAQTTGPDDDDRKLQKNYDVIKSPIDDDTLEYIDEDTVGCFLWARANVFAKQEPWHHFAKADLEYEFTKSSNNPDDPGTWRPYTSTDGESAWYGDAKAFPDSTPEEDSDNRTEAAAVGAFAQDGVIVFDGYVEEDYAITEKPHSPKVSSTNAVLLEFNKSDFKVVSSGDPDKVVIRPADDSLTTLNLFHNNAGYASQSYFPSVVSGLNSTTDELVDDMISSIASEAGLTLADPGQRAELTISSAAVQFESKTLDLKKSSNEGPVNKTKIELLTEYFNALSITATDDSQAGYTPDVQGRTALSFGSTLPLDQVDEELRDRITPVFDKDIGLFFIVEGGLEDAVNLAVDTEGTALNQLVSPMSPGDSFSIDLNFGTGESFSCYDSDKSAVADFGVADIGGSEPPGSVEIPEGTRDIVVTAGGEGIGGNEDQFSFAYLTDELGQPVQIQISNDFIAIVNVDSVETTGGPDTWAKAGLMIRESMEPGSSFAMVAVTPEGVKAEGRDEDGGAPWEWEEGDFRFDLPYSLYLERHGNTFTFWVAAGEGEPSWWDYERQLPLSDDMSIGLVTISNQQGTPVRTQFSNFNVIPFITEPESEFTPANGEEDVDAYPLLSWPPSTDGTGDWSVYVSNDSTAVYDLDPSAYLGSTTENVFPIGPLCMEQRYYSLVVGPDDQRHAWSFITGPQISNQITRDVWTGISGSSVDALTGDPRYPDQPDLSEPLDWFAAPFDWDDNYGQRLSGWLKPPETGDYTFWISADDNAVLYLSTDKDPANAEPIARVPGWNSVDEWDKYPEQKSPSIYLETGQKYYIEGLHKEDMGGDHIVAAWQIPGGDREIISGVYVDTFPVPSPFATQPSPSDGQSNTDQSLTLTWTAGENALFHHIFFGESLIHIAMADTDTDEYKGRQTETTYSPGPLKWGNTYYWQVDEEEADGTIRKGPIWRFTTADFYKIEDFEDYDDDVAGGTAVFGPWGDFWTGNGSDAQIGHDFNWNGTFCETEIVFFGKQSAPLYYNMNFPNTAPYSETGRTFTSPLDLTVNGMDTLTFYIHGQSNNTVIQLYVGLKSGATRVNIPFGDPTIVQSTSWIEVSIPLADFAPVDPTAVDSIFIRLGESDVQTPGNFGLVFIDSIRATKAAEIPQAPEVTLNLKSQVSASDDDGYASNDSLQNLSSDFLRVGLSSFAGPPYYLSGMVFKNVDIPQEAEIVSAKLKVQSHNNRLTDTVYGVIKAEATDNANAFDSSRRIGSLPTTNTSVDWTIEEPWSADTWYESPDIAGVIQEVIDRPGWSESNSLAIICGTKQDQGGYRNISSFDRGSDSAPILEITYIP